MNFQKVFSNRQVFMFSNTLVEVSDCVAVFCLFCRSFVELNVLKNRSLFVIHTG